MKKIFIFITLFFIFSNKLLSQNQDNRWVFGIHTGLVIYSDKDAINVGGAYIDQVPRITVSRYMFSNITFEGAFSTSLIDAQKYTTFDGLARYDFGKSYENFVPYILLGGSLISANLLTPTLNFGAGGTYWVFSNYGINVQLMYKFSESRFESQFSHIYPTVGIFYSFKSKNSGQRLWDVKH